MINHISIGVLDIARARHFYDAVLKPLDYRRLSEGDGSLGYGRGEVSLWISAVERPVPADERSGLHICFNAPSADSVDRFHGAALAAGGSDNGKPGFRDDYARDYYAAFVVDPDGYRIEAYCGPTTA